MTIRPDWIAADWTPSTLRAWAMGPEGPLAEASSDHGAGGLAGADFEAALLDLVAPWLAAGRAAPVVACGMAGAPQGWVEAACRVVPCPPLGPPLALAPATDPRLAVRIVPGLAQRAPSPDVMNGGETRIAGLLALRPGWDGVVCLPGTLGAWAELSAGEVVSFRTFLTGELHELLATRSILRHGLGDDPDAFDDAAFDAAVTDALARPEALAARLYQIRAAGLLDGLSPAAARARLSGLLIGAELAAAKPWWLGRDVVILGGDRLARLYARALAPLGVTAGLVPADAATLAGLAVARALADA